VVESKVVQVDLASAGGFDGLIASLGPALQNSQNCMTLCSRRLIDWKESFKARLIA
jgi:hypothetical protein